MEIRYRREISHNYLIIKTDGLGEDYEMRMAEENCVGGFLPLLICAIWCWGLQGR